MNSIIGTLTDHESCLKQIVSNASKDNVLINGKIRWDHLTQTLSWDSPITFEANSKMSINSTENKSTLVQISKDNKIKKFNNGIHIPTSHGLYYAIPQNLNTISNAYPSLNLLDKPNIQIYTAEKSGNTNNFTFVSMFENKTENELEIGNGISISSKLPYIICKSQNIKLIPNKIMIFLYSTSIPRKQKYQEKTIENFNVVTGESIRVDIELLKEDLNKTLEKEEMLQIKKNKISKYNNSENITINDALKKLKVKKERTQLLIKEMTEFYNDMENSDSSLEDSLEENGMNSVSSNSSDLSEDSSENASSDSSFSDDSSMESDVKLSWEVGTKLPMGKVAIANIIVVDSVEELNIGKELLLNVGKKRIPILMSMNLKVTKNVPLFIVNNKDAKNVLPNQKLLAINLSGRVKFTPNNIYFNAHESNIYDTTLKTYEKELLKPSLIKSKKSKKYFTIYSFNNSIKYQKLIN